MTIYEALGILKSKEDYIVPNCTFDIALEIIIQFVQNSIDKNI